MLLKLPMVTGRGNQCLIISGVRSHEYPFDMISRWASSYLNSARKAQEQRRDPLSEGYRPGISVA